MSFHPQVAVLQFYKREKCTYKSIHTVKLGIAIFFYIAHSPFYWQSQSWNICIQWTFNDQKHNYLFSSLDVLIMVATENLLKLGCTLCPAALIVIPWTRTSICSNFIWNYCSCSCSSSSSSSSSTASYIYSSSASQLPCWYQHSTHLCLLCTLNWLKF